MQFPRQTGLQVKDLACFRGDRMVFSRLNFEVLAGQLLEVVGPNGCGKTSLLRMLCGLIVPEHGEILWCQQNVHEHRLTFIESLAFVGHQDAIKSELTVAENLRLTTALSRRNNLTLHEVLQRLHLQERVDHLTYLLSAGQKRRLALSRLLLSTAQLWILDEPFTALDKLAIQAVIAMLSEHAAQGGMVIFTSHHGVKIPNVRLLELAPFHG